MTTTLVPMANICLYLILCVMATSAFAKSRDINSFVFSLEQYFHVPPSISKVVALALIGLEWTTALLIVAGYGVFAASLALALLMVFTAVQFEVVINKRYAMCSCFGASAEPISALDLLRNTTYIVAAILALSFSTAQALPEINLHSLLQWLAALLLFLMSLSFKDIKILLIN